MNNPIRLLRILCFAALFLPVPSYATEIKTDAASFQQASVLSTKLDNDAQVQEYRNKAFSPKLESTMNKHVAECLRGTKQPDLSTFHFVITLDEKGKTKEIDLDKSTTISSCLTHKMAKESFPAPPRSPFAEKVDMKLTP